jgi:hypothetical protein
MEYTHIADQLLTAGTALAGLILIFLSNAVTAYEAYSPTERTTVRQRYRSRSLLAFCAFTGALVSAILSLIYYWISVSCLIIIGAGFFVASLICALIAAYTAVGDIG